MTFGPAQIQNVINIHNVRPHSARFVGPHGTRRDRF
jgi:hypothetical protein